MTFEKSIQTLIVGLEKLANCSFPLKVGCLRRVHIQPLEAQARWVQDVHVLLRELFQSCSTYALARSLREPRHTADLASSNGLSQSHCGAQGSHTSSPKNVVYCVHLILYQVMIIYDL